MNPVEQRLAYLCNEWLQFRDQPATRVLIWQAPENAFRLIQAFVEAQKHESDYASGDVFIPFTPPYQHALQYSRALKEALRGQYDASREQLQSEGLDADWDFDPTKSLDTPAAFATALKSLAAKYAHSLNHLVAVLTPSAVTDEAAFQDWVRCVLKAELPERIRLLLVDSLENPRWQSLSAAKDPRIEVSRPQVDSFVVAQETFAQEPAAGPAGVFRSLLLGAVALAEKGDADAVKIKAHDALAFARQQRWLDQEVVLHVVMAGAFLKENRHGEAVSVYQDARRIALQATEQAHPAGNKLLLQTWFGEAGAEWARGDASAAGHCYDEAALSAQQDRNAILGIEAFRMGAVCHARVGDVAGALERGNCALELGEKLKPESRPMTTLPLAAIDLLRVLHADTLGKIEQLKAEWERRSHVATQALERQVAALDEAATLETEQAIEENHRKEVERLRTEAKNRLEQLLAQAPEPFRRSFLRSRELLGDHWPLFEVSVT